MTNDKNYTLSVAPHSKITHIAGEFDTKTRTPRYEIKTNPSHSDIVNIVQVMLGTSEKCSWAWEIHNKSSLPVFVTILKDGEVLYIS